MHDELVASGLATRRIREDQAADGATARRATRVQHLRAAARTVWRAGNLRAKAWKRGGVEDEHLNDARRVRGSGPLRGRESKPPLSQRRATRPTVSASRTWKRRSMLTEEDPSPGRPLAGAS